MTELQELELKIQTFFDIPQFDEWFDESNEVLLEHTILVPNNKHDRRPDRISIKKDVVSVIDFKFGSSQSIDHIKQVKYYQKLIREMGYKEVNGYLFYGDSLALINVGDEDVLEQGSLF